MQFIYCTESVRFLTNVFPLTDLLYKKPVNKEAASLPSPEFFKNKILIKVC